MKFRSDMIDESAGFDPKAPAHNGPPLVLVSDRVLSWDWESLDRRKSRNPRDRPGPYTVETETPTAPKLIEANQLEPRFASSS
jgi:hypothetical protein